MKTQILAGAAVLALIAGGAASAATHKTAGAYAEPSQPVAYSKLDAYLKASPTKRAKQDWSVGSTTSASAAPTGAAANTSVTTGMAPASSAPASAPDNSATTAPPETAAPPAPPAPSPPDQMSAPAAPPASAPPPTTPAPATPGT
jgi:hypothetical protein